jgi:hypothetical protein
VLQAGKSPSVLVVWFQAKYHPLSLPLEMEGRVVASFRFDHDTVLKRIKQGESYATWNDLRVTLKIFHVALHRGIPAFSHRTRGRWTITKMTHHEEPPYDLYEAVSRDGKLKAEFSFRTPESPPFRKRLLLWGKFPDGNVWIRVQRVTG